MLVVLAGIVLAAGVAGAAPVVSVTVHGGSAGDGGAAALAQRVRAWLAEHPHVVVTIVVRPGRVLLEVDGRRRQLALDAWDDDTTARRIAVHALDLASATPLFADGAAAADPAPALGGGAPLPRRVALGVGVRVGRGVGRTDPWVTGIGGELGVRRGRWRVAAGLGWVRSAGRRTGEPDAAVYQAWPIAALGGVEARGVELIAGAVVAPLHLDAIMVDRRVHLGGVAALRWRPRLGPATMTVDLGAEVWARRAAVTIAGEPVFSTPRLASYLAIGAAWSSP